MRVALILEYSGERYHGWQSQPACISIQSELETAISRIANCRVGVVAAGRTDAGVHALYQVIHFQTPIWRPMSAWVRGVNALLPDDIAVLWAAEVDETFHARYCAIERRYLYYLLNHPIRPGVSQRKVGWFHKPLELEKMQQAAAMLLGEHDFSAFRTAECQAKDPVRNLTMLEITQNDHFFIFEFRANGFLHHMVRNIVSSLVYIGHGKYPPGWMQLLLQNRDRTLAAPTFSPYGLYLAGISYDAKWNLPPFNQSPLATIMLNANRSLIKV
ncbi:tRNA pseudouridine(38-40) synthase TruA [Nitrosomonas communis]|nr:tRNA pseudouridine(38-40) synthase TruA [Nitrosomonas communis]